MSDKVKILLDHNCESCKHWNGDDFSIGYGRCEILSLSARKQFIPLNGAGVYETDKYSHSFVTGKWFNCRLFEVKVIDEK